MKPSKFLLTLTLLVAGTFTAQAQIDSIVRAFVDQASRNSQQRQQPQRKQPQPRQPANTHLSKKLFDGTWLATHSKTDRDTQQTLNRSFTLIIKDGKATKTLDTTNLSSPERPFYTSIHELQRRWTYNSIECTEQGTSITIQWTAGQLSDWMPKSVPNSIVEGFGAPMAETAVYKVNGDQLTRVNDPNGLIYHKAK